MSDIVQNLVLQGKARVDEAVRGLNSVAKANRDIGISADFVKGALLGMTATMASAVYLSQQQTQTMTGLERSLKSAGIEMTDVQDRLNGLFVEMQAFTKFGDTDVAEAMRRVTNAVASAKPSFEQIAGLTTLVLDASAATGKGVQELSVQVGKLAAGDGGPLLELAPALRENVVEIQKIGDASERGTRLLALLNAQFGGAAKAMDPFSLALARIKNGTGDVLENLGDTITKSEGVTRGLSSLANMIDIVAQSFTAASPVAQGFGTMIGDAVDVAISAFRELVAGVLWMYKTVRGVTDTLGSQGLRDQQAAAIAGLRVVEEIRKKGSHATKEEIENLIRVGRQSGVLGDVSVKGWERELSAARRLSGLREIHPGDLERLRRDLEVTRVDLGERLGEDADAFSKEMQQLDSLIERVRAGRIDVATSQREVPTGLSGSRSGAGAVSTAKAEADELKALADRALAEVEAQRRRMSTARDLYIDSVREMQEHIPGALRTAADLRQTIEDIHAQLRFPEDLDKAEIERLQSLTVAIREYLENQKAYSAELQRLADEEKARQAQMRRAGTDLRAALTGGAMSAAPIESDAARMMREFDEKFAELMASIPARSAEAFGAFAVNAGNAFGAAIMSGSSFGDSMAEISAGAAAALANSFAQALAALGAALLFVNPAQGAGLIAAAAGLGIVGGALGALSGGSSAGAGTTASGARSAGFSGGYDSTGIRPASEGSGYGTTQVLSMYGVTLVTEDARTMERIGRSVQRSMADGGRV